MEIITLTGYTEGEKRAIAQQYLLPRQIRENGLRPEEIRFADDALNLIIRSYTREAGVRNLERQVGAICRKLVTQVAEGQEGEIAITNEKVRELLGKPPYLGIEEAALRTSIPGVAAGLAYTPTGGDVLFIEATRMPGSKGFQVTGSVGNVMQESAHAALSFVRSRTDQLHLNSDFFEKSDIHLHIPAGSQPKDGPSAGVTMATALVSLFSGRAVRANVGMTGEITLRGQVLPVGGIKEKVLAAHRFGLNAVILPHRNEDDLDDLPDEVRREMKFILVETVDEVIEAALESPHSAQGSVEESPAPAEEHPMKMVTEAHPR
jgi:ATP-dependent Lon protease